MLVLIDELSCFLGEWGVLKYVANMIIYNAVIRLEWMGLAQHPTSYIISLYRRFVCVRFIWIELNHIPEFLLIIILYNIPNTILIFKIFVVL